MELSIFQTLCYDIIANGGSYTEQEVKKGFSSLSIFNGLETDMSEQDLDLFKKAKGVLEARQQALEAAAVAKDAAILACGDAIVKLLTLQVEAQAKYLEEIKGLQKALFNFYQTLTLSRFEGYLGAIDVSRSVSGGADFIKKSVFDSFTELLKKKHRVLVEIQRERERKEKEEEHLRQVREGLVVDWDNIVYPRRVSKEERKDKRQPRKVVL